MCGLHAWAQPVFSTCSLALPPIIREHPCNHHRQIRTNPEKAPTCLNCRAEVQVGAAADAADADGEPGSAQNSSAFSCCSLEPGGLSDGPHNAGMGCHFCFSGLWAQVWWQPFHESTTESRIKSPLWSLEAGILEFRTISMPLRPRAVDIACLGARA